MGFLSVIGSIAGNFIPGLPPGVGSAIGSTIGGAIEGDDASKDAQREMRRGTNASIEEQRRQFDLTRRDLAPYRSVGVRSLRQLFDENGRAVTPEEVMSDPGYQFGLSQGQTAIDRKISAMGGRVSGAAIKAAGRFGTDYATAGYGAAHQRRSERLNRLAALAGVGQTAVGTTAQVGQNAANSISGVLQNQGDANATARLQRGSIWQNAGNQIAALYQPRAGGFGGTQAAFSQTGLGSSGFGSGMAYGNQDLGQYFG